MRSVGRNWEQKARMPYVNDNDLRIRLIELCRDEDRHFVGHWKDGHPSRWHPDRVPKPGEKRNFQFGEEPWEYIADLLEQFWAYKEEPLKKPPGHFCYEMNIPGSNGRGDLYIKFVLTIEGTLIGRSFHISGE